MTEELAGGKLVLDRPAEAVARLTLNNPAKRNVLDHDVLDAIAEVMPRLDDGIETRCVLITGEPPVFSAGYDIGSIPAESFERDAERLVAHPFHDAMNAGHQFRRERHLAGSHTITSVVGARQTSAMGAYLSKTAFLNSSVELLFGNGTSGTGLPRKRQSSLQPLPILNTSNRSGGMVLCTVSL